MVLGQIKFGTVVVAAVVAAACFSPSTTPESADSIGSHEPESTLNSHVSALLHCFLLSPSHVPTADSDTTSRFGVGVAVTCSFPSATTPEPADSIGSHEPEPTLNLHVEDLLHCFLPSPSHDAPAADSDPTSRSSFVGQTCS